jgi:hypothetical protein
MAKKKAKIEWKPAPIYYDMPLDATHLNAEATHEGKPIPGKFKYSHDLGKVLLPGKHRLTVTHEPEDEATYAVVEKAVEIDVWPVPTTINWSNPANIVYGTALDSTQLNATATDPQGSTVDGTFTYNPPAGTVLPAGTHTLSVSFTPDDTTCFTDAPATTTSLNVDPATPAVSVTGGTFIYDGNAHPATASATGLGWASVAGSFAFTYTQNNTQVASPTNAGKYAITASFTSDDSNYKNPPSGTGSTVINQAAPLFSGLTASQTITFGTETITVSGTLTAPTAIPMGTVSISINGTGVSQVASVSSGGSFTATLATDDVPASPTPYTITYSYPGDTNFKPKKDSSTSLTVVRTTPAFSGLTSPVMTYGTGPTILSGKITADSLIPTGLVSITLAGQTQKVPIESDGSFSASFDTSALAVSGSPYPITYSYAGDNNFGPPSDGNTNLTFRTVQITGNVTFADGGVPGVTVAATDAQATVVVPILTNGVPASATTDSNGAYTLVLPAGKQLRVGFPASTSVNGQNVFIRGPQNVYCQPYKDISLPDVVYELRGCRISGSVQRQIAGATGYEPFAGVPIELVDHANQAILDHQNSDAQGNFCFLAKKSGTFTLRFAEMIVESDVLTAADDVVGVSILPDRHFELATPVTYTLELARVLGQVNDGRKGLERVSVKLFSQATKKTYTTDTDDKGYFEFPPVPPGKAQLSFPSTTTDSSGQVWELQASQPNLQSFDLAAGDLKTAALVSYQPEQHIIQWSVTVEGQPAPGKLVEVWSSDEKTVIAAQRSKNDGTVYFKLDQGGDFLVKVYPDDRVPGGVLARHVAVHSTASGSTDIPASPAAARQPGLKNGEVRESVVDLQAYPVLTEEVPAGGPAAPVAVPSAPGVAPIGQIAQNAIRDVLSWRTKPNDPKSFLMALNQSFALKDVEGHTEFTWTPRSYTVQTDLGVVTGAQASIYTRAKVALDQSVPLLDGLYPLVPNVEPEDLESIRSVVRSLLTSLVNEFGVEGGPRVPRVDELFLLLIGPGSPTDPEHAGGRLADLQNRFGLKRQFVTTIEDEQNLTNYLILVDYVTGLNQSWNAQRGFFSRNGSTGEPFFGTQLVLLSRALDVVTQSVKDAYFTLDSVFLGAAERQTIPLTFSGLKVQVPVNGSLQTFIFPPTEENPTPTSSLFVAELLDWVDRAASDELPRLVQDAGKDSISSMVDILDTLRKFAHAAVIAPFGPQPLNGLPPGYRTPRVQRALIELADQLDEAFRLASQIKSPRFPAFNNSSQGTGSGAGGRSS